MTNTNALKAWRKAKGLNQEAASHEVGVDRITWWRWENGKSPVGIKSIGRVSRATGLSAHELRPDLFQAEGDSQ